MALRGGMFGLTGAILSYAIALVAIFVLAWIVDALAPTFGGEKNFVASLKLAAYSWTAVWVAGIFHLLPFIGGVIGLLAMIYAFYTFSLGAPVVKKCPAEKAAGYTIVVVICAVVLFVLIGGALTSPMGGMMGMGMALSADGWRASPLAPLTPLGAEVGVRRRHHRVRKPVQALCASAGAC
jgi:hypothetical protein